MTKPHSTVDTARIRPVPTHRAPLPRTVQLWVVFTVVATAFVAACGSAEHAGAAPSSTSTAVPSTSASPVTTITTSSSTSTSTSTTTSTTTSTSSSTLAPASTEAVSESTIPTAP